MCAGSGIFSVVLLYFLPFQPTQRGCDVRRQSEFRVPTGVLIPRPNTQRIVAIRDARPDRPEASSPSARPRPAGAGGQRTGSQESQRDGSLRNSGPTFSSSEAASRPQSPDDPRARPHSPDDAQPRAVDFTFDWDHPPTGPSAARGLDFDELSQEGIHTSPTRTNAGITRRPSLVNVVETKKLLNRKKSVEDLREAAFLDDVLLPEEDAQTTDDIMEVRRAVSCAPGGGGTTSAGGATTAGSMVKHKTIGLTKQASAVNLQREISGRERSNKNIALAYLADSL